MSAYSIFDREADGPLPAQSRHRSAFGLQDLAVPGGANGLKSVASFPPF